MRSTNYARGAGMLCTRKPFWRYINSLHNEIVCRNQKDAQEFMYSEFEITSRRELNSNMQAQKRYIEFVGRFNAWLGTQSAGVPDKAAAANAAAQ